MRSLSFFFLVSCLSGCSYLGLENPFDRSADDYSKTEVGAGTGAVLGAGLGAVVGSASGNAGEGVAIGAIAGGAAGGLIGRQLEKNDQAIDQQGEALIREREMLAAQGRQIGDLQKSFDDEFPNNRPSVSPSNPTSGSSFTQPQTNSFAGNDTTSRARLDVVEPAASTGTSGAKLFPIAQANAPSRARSYSVETAAIDNSNTISSSQVVKPLGAATEQLEVKQVSQEQEVANFQEEIDKQEQQIVIKEKQENIEEQLELSAKKEDLQIKAKEQAIVAKKMELPKAINEEKIEEKKEEVLKNEPAGEGSKETEPKVDLASFNPDDLQPYDANCMQAQQEAARAEKATSDADKLFYYKRALRLCATEPAYHVGIAKVYEAIGRLDDARFEYGQALQLDPDNTTASKNLAALK